MGSDSSDQRQSMNKSENDTEPATAQVDSNTPPGTTSESGKQPTFIADSVYAVTDEGGHGNLIIVDETAPMSQWLEFTPGDDSMPRWHVCARCGYAAPSDSWCAETNRETVCPECDFDHSK